MYKNELREIVSRYELSDEEKERVNVLKGVIEEYKSNKHAIVGMIIEVQETLLTHIDN